MLELTLFLFQIYPEILTMMYYFETVRPLEVSEPVRPKRPIKVCPPHKWEEDEEFGLKCAICKQPPQIY